MTSAPPTLRISDEPEMVQIAARVGAVLKAGDVLLLEGPVGAGKSFFARALIQSLQLHPEDVPSPTFTLVQTYDTEAGEIWHADLYRLSSPDEAAELGLIDALDDAVCLIEWPDRLGPLTPDHAVTLLFHYDPSSETARALDIHGTSQTAARIGAVLHEG